MYRKGQVDILIASTDNCRGIDNPMDSAAHANDVGSQQYSNEGQDRGVSPSGSFRPEQQTSDFIRHSGSPGLKVFSES